MSSTIARSGPVPRVESLRDYRVSVVTAVVTLPTVGTALVMMALFFTVGTSPLPNTATLVYGAANVVVGLGLFQLLTPGVRRAVFRYERPTGEELAAAILVAAVAVVVIGPLVVRIASVLNVNGSTSVATFDSATGAVIVGVGALLVAPVVEEVLFRGLLFGTLLTQYDSWIAILGSSAVFGGIHLFLSGLPGIFESFLIGVGFAGMRFRYDNLAGVSVSHALINAYYVAAGIGLLPSLVP